MDADEYRFQTADGQVVRVRPEQPDDAVHLVRLFSGLSPNSRYLRFSKALQNPDPDLVRREAERLARLEPPADVAWLAFADLPGAPDEPIAGARYVRLPSDPQSAEVAISVRDDLQRQGIGSTLLKFIAEHARRHGIQRLAATFRSENRAVWALLQRAPYRFTWELDGPEVHAAIDLTAPQQEA
jgi:acetyltransferase